MGFFDFLKPKKKEPLDEYAQAMMKLVFPAGEVDLLAGTNEVLDILNHSVSKEIARNILIKSTMICRIVTMKKDGDNKFDVDRLRMHLSTYCIEYFNESQIRRLHGYQVSMLTASLMGKSPKDVKRSGENYYS
jgi:hypothetical protein